MIGLWFVMLAWAERPITLAEALVAAVAKEPALAQAGAAVDAAEGTVMAANGQFDPLFQVQGSLGRRGMKGFFQGFPYSSSARTWGLSSSIGATSAFGTQASLSTRLDRNYSRYITDFPGSSDERIQDAWAAGVDLSIAQQLLEGNRRSYNARQVALARAGWDASKLQLERQRQLTLEAATVAWWRWQSATKAAEISRDALATAIEADRVGEAQLGAGSIAAVDRARLAAALLAAKTQLTVSEAAALDARDDLLVSMGETPGQDVIPASTGDGTALVVGLDPSTLVERALAGNLDVLLARNLLDQAKQRWTFAKHQTLPSLTATLDAGLGSQEATGGEAATALFTRPFTNVTGGAVLAVPVGNRAARGARDAAVAQVHSQELALSSVERDVTAQVYAAARAVETAMRNVDNARGQANLAEEVLKAEDARLAQGRGLQKDVLEARAAATQAHVSVYQALAAYHSAEAALLRLHGALGR
jgi:outer membrane protein